MENTTMKVVGDKLLIEVALAQDAGPSKSGTTILIAPTEGNAARVDIKIGLNVLQVADTKS
jgi:hypothetical protein